MRRAHPNRAGAAGQRPGTGQKTHNWPNEGDRRLQSLLDEDAASAGVRNQRAEARGRGILPVRLKMRWSDLERPGP